MNKNETVIIYSTIPICIETNGQIYSLFNNKITRQIENWNAIATTNASVKDRCIEGC